MIVDWVSGAFCQHQNYYCLDYIITWSSGTAAPPAGIVIPYMGISGAVGGTP